MLSDELFGIFLSLFDGNDELLSCQLALKVLTALQKSLLAPVLVKPGIGHLVIKTKTSFLGPTLLEVLIDLLQSIQFAYLNHFVVPFLVEFDRVSFLFPEKVDRGLDGVAPVGTSVALDADVVGWPMLQVALLALGHGMPCYEFGEELDVFEYLLIDGYN